MLTFEEVSLAAHDLRSRTEVERTHLGGFLTLVIAAAFSYFFPRNATLPYFLFVLLLLVLGPLVLPRVVPKGNLLTYRLAIFAYPIEGLLLGFIAFMEIWKILPLNVPELPTINAVLPMPGLDAIMTRSDFCQPLSTRSSLVNPLGTPVSPSL